MMGTFITGIPAEIAVIVLAMTPVGELRAAIPVGILGYHLPVWEVFLLAQLGNAVPVVLIYALCDWWVRMIERRKGLLHRVTHAVLQHTQEKMHGGMSKWGYAALVIFVAIPLPGAGAWTGTLGAYLLHIPLKKAFPYIILGNLIAGTIVTLAVTGVVAAFKVFL
jgi:uncharacterized membrane protein